MDPFTKVSGCCSDDNNDNLYNTKNHSPDTIKGTFTLRNHGYLHSKIKNDEDCIRLNLNSQLFQLISINQPVHKSLMIIQILIEDTF